MQAMLQGNVREAMVDSVEVVPATLKIQELAKLFEQRGISSAPVVDEVSRCIGIITNSDLVRFQSQLDNAYARIDHGMTFEVSGSGDMALVPHPFDEVQRHMSTAVQTISPESSLVEVAQVMSEQRIHHLVVLDESGGVIGTLSSLDLLSKLMKVSGGSV